MVWIIALIGIGFLLILAEVFFVPGTTIVGILGVVLAGSGVYMVYQHYGATTGHLTLGIALVVFLISLIGGFRSKAWQKYAMNDSLHGKTNVLTAEQVQTGDTGKAVSAIKPMGKARINGENFEVQSYSDFIDSGEQVEVTKIAGKTIYVKRAPQ